MNDFDQAGDKLLGPLRTLAIVLSSSLAVTSCFLYSNGEPPQMASPAGAVQTIVGGAAAPLLQRAGIPSPTLEPGMAQQAQSMAGKSMTIAEKALDTVDVTVDTGDRVVRYGAGLVDQMLPSSPAFDANSNRAATGGENP